MTQRIATTINIEYTHDATNVTPYVAGGGAVPEGTYAAYVSAMEVRENNGKNGHNLNVEYTIAEGEFKGRKIYDNWNLWHQASEGAVEIAHKKLAAVQHAVNCLQMTNFGQLGGIVHMVTVDFEEATPETTNPNTGEKVKGRPARNSILRNDPYQVPQTGSGPNFGGSPVPGAPASPMAAAAAPAAQPAAQPAAAPAQPPAAAQPPAQAAAPAANAAPAAAPGAPAGVPPWQKKAA